MESTPYWYACMLNKNKYCLSVPILVCHKGIMPRLNPGASSQSEGWLVCREPQSVQHVHIIYV